MGDETDLEICRLCLNIDGLLLNIFDENSKIEFMLEKTIEDLLAVKVVEDANYPWLVCSNCTEKLTEFRLFKHRCEECLFVFYNRIQKGCNPATKDWITNRDECSGEIKKEIIDDTITSETVDNGTVDVTNDMIIVKEEIDAASECSAPPLRDVESSMVSSIQEGCSQWTDNKEAGNIFPAEMKEEFGVEEITADSRTVGVQDDITIVKEEIDTAGVHSAANKGDVQLAMIAISSMKGRDSHYSDNGEAGSLFPAEMKEEFVDEEISGDAIDGRTVDIQEDISIVKEEIDAGNEHSAANEGVVQWEMVTSMKGRGSYCSDNEEAGNLDHSEDLELHLSSEKEGYNKVADDVEILKKQEGFGRKLLLTQVSDCKKKCDEAEEKATDTPMHACQICHNVFAQRDLLKDHMMFLHIKTGKQFRCDVCLEGFESKSSIASHIKSVHALKKKHQYKWCSRNFQKLSVTETHMSTHARERRHKCDICSTGFAKISTLKRHVLTHTDERPFNCVICCKTFTRKDTLNDHMVMHTGEWRHKCGQCEKAFSKKWKLKRHTQLVHTDERPFKCHICSKTFNLKHTLKIHIITHSADRPHQCKLCPKSFAQNGDLNRHMETHTGLQSHKCKLCSKAFTLNRSLRRHMLTH